MQLDKQPIFYQQLVYMLVAQRLQRNPHLLARSYHVFMGAERQKHGEVAQPLPCLYGSSCNLRCGTVRSDGANRRITPPARLHRPDPQGGPGEKGHQDRSV